MNSEFQTMMVRSRIDIALFALKSVFVLNGGALVATMLFAGNIVANPITQQSSLFLNSIIYPLLLFSLGVVFSALSGLAGYFSQTYYSNDDQDSGIKYMWMTMSLAVGAVVLFTGGVFIAVYQLANIV